MADDARPMLAPKPIPEPPAATLPSEAYDPEHPEHDAFVRTAGRRFATDCPRHDPKENR